MNFRQSWRQNVLLQDSRYDVLLEAVRGQSHAISTRITNNVYEYFEAKIALHVHQHCSRIFT